MQSYALDAELLGEFFAVVEDSDLPGKARRQLKEGLTVNVSSLTHNALKFSVTLYTNEYNMTAQFSTAEVCGGICDCGCNQPVDGHTLTMDLERCPEWSGSKFPEFKYQQVNTQRWGFFSCKDIARLGAEMLVATLTEIGM